MRLRPSSAQSILAFLLFFSMGLGIMWPAPIHAGSSLFGPPGRDLTGDISDYRVLAQAHLAPFLPGIIHAWNAPEGRVVEWALNLASLPSSTLLWVGSMAIGAVATFTYWAVFTFALSALSMFLFARWITGRWEAGLVAGLAWGFQPFVFSGQNQPLGDVFVVVIFAWRMFAAIERPSLRNGIWVGLAFLLAATWMQYYLLIMAVAWAVLVVCALVVAWIRRELAAGIAAQAAGAVPIALGLSAILVAGIAGSFSGAATRTQADLIQASARPAMYILPDPNNPFTGTLSRGYISHHFGGSPVAYSNIYVGLSMLALAVGGLFVLVRSVRRRGLVIALQDRRILVALPLTVLSVVAFLFSMPPHLDVFGIEVPMPMDGVFRLTQVFRAVARFEILVMLGVCVLSALAISEVLPRLRRTPVRLIVLAVVAFVVTADLWARADVPITRIRIPSVYHVLARQPKGIYAEFPLLTGASFGGLTYDSFYQGWAGDHRLFEGFLTGSDEQQSKLALSDPLAPATETTLADYGVRYLIVDSAHYGLVTGQFPHQGQRLPGARLIARDRYGSLYRVTATPPRLSAMLTANFSVPEASGTSTFQWLAGSSGTFQVINHYPHPVTVEVRFSSLAFGPPRRVGIFDAAGRSLYNGVVTATPGLVTFTARIDHVATFRLTSSPGAIPVKQLDPASTDTRSLSVQVSIPLSITRLR